MSETSTIVKATEDDELKFVEKVKLAYSNLVQKDPAAERKVKKLLPELKMDLVLYNAIEAKYGGSIRKFFLSSKHVGLSHDNYISVTGHHSEFIQHIVDIIERSETRSVRLHVIRTEMVRNYSASGFQKALQGYGTLERLVQAYSQLFQVSKKGQFVTLVKAS